MRPHMDSTFQTMVNLLMRERESTMEFSEEAYDGVVALQHLQDTCCPRTEMTLREARRNWESYGIPEKTNIMAHNAEFNNLYELVVHRGGRVPERQVIDQYFASISDIKSRNLSVYACSLRLQCAASPGSLSLYKIQALLRDEEQFHRSNRAAREKYAPVVKKASKANSVETSKSSPKPKGKPKSDSKKPAPKGKARDPSKVTCWGCNKVGHHLQDCKTTSKCDKASIGKKKAADFAKTKSERPAIVANIEVDSPSNPMPASSSANLAQRLLIPRSILVAGDSQSFQLAIRFLITRTTMFSSISGPLITWSVAFIN
jgi:hypothetical protein